MNILLFIFSLLMIFALEFSLSFERSLLSVHIEKELSERKNAIRMMHNSYEQKRWKGLKKKKKEMTSQGQSNSQNRDKPKKQEELPPCIRLNLYPLLQHQDQQLEEIAISLLAYVCKEPFEEYGISPAAFFSLFIEKAKIASEKENFHLGKIDFEDELLQHIYYLLLQRYSLQKYITFSPQQPPICMPCATYEILAAICGDEVAKKLLQDKQDPMERLTKEKLKLYCNGSLRKYIRFSHPKNIEKSYTGKTDKAQLTRSW